MRPLPSIVLSGLLLAVCALCGWQWHRESQLRSLTETMREDLDRASVRLADANGRAQTANAEILRMTGALAELRETSVSRAEYDELAAAAAAIKETAEQLRTMIQQQNETILKANEAIEKTNAATQAANGTIQRLTTERDELVRKLNDLTERYNKLVKP